MKEKSDNKIIEFIKRINYHKFSIYFAALIGILVFYIIYGFEVLDVTNDNWILSGYDEEDIVQHYSGWLAFRNSDWNFPLGLVPEMGVGVGTIISFTDSIPWLSILFKLFRSILPETFQFFGIYTLLCYILQAIAAYKIVYFKSKDDRYALLGTILLCFSPILMERAFRHTALGSQWLILFSIYIYMKHCKEPSLKSYLYFLILELLAIGIHPYFIPMIGVFALLCVIKDISSKRKNVFLSIIFFVGIQVVTYFVGYIIGTLGWGVSLNRRRIWTLFNEY